MRNHHAMNRRQPAALLLLGLVLAGACAPRSYLLSRETFDRTTAVPRDPEVVVPAVREPGVPVLVRPAWLDPRTAVVRGDGQVAVRALPRRRNALLVTGGIFLGIGAALAIVMGPLTREDPTALGVILAHAGIGGLLIGVGLVERSPEVRP